MNTAVCCMYDDLEALNVDVVDVKLKNNFAIAFFEMQDRRTGTHCAGA